MVSHMNAVQVALLFNSYLVHFYSQRNCSFDIMSIQPGKRRFISTGATTWRETQWPGVIRSKRTGGQIDRSGSESWLSQCDFERDTLLSQCLTRSRSINGYRRNCQENLTKCRGGMRAGVGWGQGWDGGRGLPVMDSHSIQMKKQYSDSASLL